MEKQFYISHARHLNTENQSRQNLVAGVQLHKKASQVLLNVILTGELAHAEF